MEDESETVVNTFRVVERKEDSKHCQNFQEYENLQRRRN